MMRSVVKKSGCQQDTNSDRSEQFHIFYKRIIDFLPTTLDGPTVIPGNGKLVSGAVSGMMYAVAPGLAQLLP
jgi:hypothetical protein